MSKSSYNSEECVESLNNIKNGLQIANKPISKKVLLECLKNCGLPSCSTFWIIFRNSGLIQEVSRGFYLFTDTKPINVKALDILKRRDYEYNKKYFTKRTKEPEAVEMVEEVEILGEVEEIQEMAVASAIALLKSKGYIIAKPVVSSLTIL